jgi:pimeloyl-ACP methyl ester carboxylesterase
MSMWDYDERAPIFDAIGLTWLINKIAFFPPAPTYAADDCRRVLGVCYIVIEPEARTRAGSVLYIHGNAGDIGGSKYGGRLKIIANMVGAPIYAFDPPGYGHTPGPAGASWVTAACCVLATMPQPVALWGLSMGGHVAAALANESAGIVLESAFASMFDVLTLFGGALLRLVGVHRMSNDAAVARAAVPVWVFHGDADRVINVEHGVRLVAAAGARYAGGAIVKGAAHGEVAWKVPTHIAAALASILDGTSFSNT